MDNIQLPPFDFDPWRAWALRPRPAHELDVPVSFGVVGLYLFAKTDTMGAVPAASSVDNTALLGYAFADGSGRSGVIPLTRLLANVTCGVNGDNGHAMGAYALSGSWADPGAKGQGLVIEVNPLHGQLFAGWFTYAVNATSNVGPSAQRWYSLQAGIGSSLASPISVGIYEMSGGAFNAAGQVTTAPVGSAQLQFQSCSTATLSYAFTSGSNVGQSGTLHLGRVVPAPAGCVLL